MAEYFGEVCWCDDDILSAFEYHCYEHGDADIAAVRKIVDCDAFRAHMVEAGWDFIHTAIHNYMNEKEAIDRRAKEGSH